MERACLARVCGSRTSYPIQICALYVLTCMLCWWYSQLKSPVSLLSWKTTSGKMAVTEPRIWDPAWPGGLNSCTKSLIFEWTDLFPQVQFMLSETYSVPKDGDITNAIYTKLVLKRNYYLEGEELEAKIWARSNNGHVKRYGGDYFRAVLRPDNSTQNGVRCDVQDDMNGTYSVRCKLLWHGKSRLWVSLMHPSEGIYHLIRNTSGLQTHVRYNTIFLHPNGVNETSKCAMSFAGEYKPSELCNFSHTGHGEPWFCIKPATGNCSAEKWQAIGFPSFPITKDASYSAYFDQTTNYNVEISGSGATVYISPDKSETLPGRIRGHVKQNPCNALPTVGRGRGDPDGWMENGAWKSTTCKMRRFDANETFRCLGNITLYAIGDSTMRLWYDFYQNFLHGEEFFGDLPRRVWSRSKTLFDARNNITVHYRAHGPPLRNWGPPRARPWVRDTVASINTDGANTILFFTIGFHFEVYDPSVFIRRIKLIKSDFLELLKRLPGVRIYVKGLNSHTEVKHVIASDWLTYRFEMILRNVFEGVSGITYIRMWDVSVVMQNQLIHPRGREQEIYAGIFQSYVCG